MRYRSISAISGYHIEGSAEVVVRELRRVHVAAVQHQLLLIPQEAASLRMLLLIA